ncbi:MAG TPA: chromosomal replication initiator protein DnaA [Acidobacteriota bacterium]|nr:chromosomal replication initiator protein DnaA [Acidobacteriota bacterium]
MTLWDQLSALLQTRVSSQIFETWFRSTSLEKCDSVRRRIEVRVPNSTHQYWLSEHYTGLVKQCLKEAGFPDYEVAFVTATNGNDTKLNAKYTFDRFVVGFCNQFAHAASLAVAEQPSKAYNPLFIYGGTGLGKTHLMHAIGHAINQKQPGLRLLYLSSEKFVNDLINAIRYDTTLQFRENYRNIDVLLMDDIQFLAGKERTQEEFFHTFNALYDAQKQIVISSDSAPKEIPTLEERLHSRFEWGLIADIQPPDLETKLAILKKKAEQEGVTLPENVALFIATHIKSNIRELEGSLVRLLAFRSLTGEEITLSFAERVLKNITDKYSRVLTIDTIVKAVADFFALKPSELKSKSNAKRIAEPRQIAMFLCRDLMNCSLTDIGREFGGKHHTTVLHSIRKIDQLRLTNPKISAALNKLNDVLH